LAAADTAVRSAQTGVSIASGERESVAQAEIAIQQRELGVSQAQSALEMAQKNFEDSQALYDIGAISAMELDMAETAVNNAEIGVTQAESMLEQARLSAGDGSRRVEDGVRRARDGVAQATAQRNALRVNLDAAMEMLNNTAVTAPISGVISARNIEPQAMLVPNLPPFTIVSIDTIIVSINVTEMMVNRIQHGQEVSVHISAASDTPFTGEVVLVSPTANEMTATFSVDISINNREGKLRPGMFAEAFFIREESLGGIVVPRGAVLLEEGVQVVYIAEGDRAVKRAVTTGIDSGAEIEITAGLSVGEMLIVRGQTFVGDGTLIQVMETGGGAN